MELSPAVVALLGLVGAGAGGLGALVGLGGGVLLVPTLIVAFGFDVRVAVATSLVAVIATSTAAGAVYVAEGQTNLRLGMTLEVATTVGGITGGLIATLIPTSVLAVLLGVALLVTAVLLVRGRSEHEGGTEAGEQEEGYEEVGRLAGAFVDERSGQLVRYEARRTLGGSAVSAVAGLVSGMLGVGGGFLKVPAMNLVMEVPLKVAAATSNFMIGVTALSSAAVYAARGYLHPYVAAPVAIGVVGGALVGARLQGRSSPRILQLILAAVLVGVAGYLFIARGGGRG